MLVGLKNKYDWFDSISNSKKQNMKGKFNLAIGLVALASVVYYLVMCPSVNCNERIIGFQVPGMVYLLFWATIAVVLLYGVYQQNTKTHE